MMCVFFVWPTFDSVSWIAYENQITIMIMITLYICIFVRCHIISRRVTLSSLDVKSQESRAMSNRFTGSWETGAGVGLLKTQQ